MSVSRFAVSYTLREAEAAEGRALGACAAENIAAAKPHKCCLEQDFFCMISHFRALSRAKFDRKRDISFDESSYGAGS